MEPLNVIYGLHLVGEPERIRYVGLTKRGATARLAAHGHEATARPTWPANRWKVKHGFENVTHIILEVVAHERDLPAAEIGWIAHFRSLGLADLNVTDGGEGALGHIPTAEHRAKISAANTGLVRTPEQRARMSAGMIGLKKSAEHCAALSAAKRGVKVGPRSAGTGARVSERIKGAGNPGARFTEAAVRELFATYHAGGWTQRALAEKHGVSQYAVQAIVTGVNWSHLNLMATIDKPFDGRTRLAA